MHRKPEEETTHGSATGDDGSAARRPPAGRAAGQGPSGRARARPWGL